MSHDVPAVTTTVRLDWSDPQHWADELKPCRLGDGPTRSRDAQGQPCHKSCAERELAAEITTSKDGRLPNERYRPANPSTGGAK